jgi:uncharacterized membrane protein
MSNPLSEKPNLEPLRRSGSAAVILDGRYLPPPEDKDGKLWARATVRIQAGSQGLYQLWRDVEKAPLWQEQIVAVSRTGEKASHWTMKAGDKTIEWDSEVLADEPAKRIAWQTLVR